jgi:hypothetical protein
VAVHCPCRITPTFSGNNAGADIAAFFIPWSVLPGMVGGMAMQDFYSFCGYVKSAFSYVYFLF